MKCPKCAYERQPSDEAPDWQCPSCKVAYVKVMQAKNPEKQAESHHGQRPPIGRAVVDRDIELAEEALHEQHALAAHGQKIVIYSIILNMVVRAIGRNQAMSNWMIEALFIAVAVYALIGIVKICSGLGLVQGQKIVFMVLSFFPLINLIALVYLNIKTSRMLRDAGWTVGLMGARP
jgi:hypothetical protein